MKPKKQNKYILEGKKVYKEDQYNSIYIGQYYYDIRNKKFFLFHGGASKEDLLQILKFL